MKRYNYTNEYICRTAARKNSAIGAAGIILALLFCCAGFAAVFGGQGVIALSKTTTAPVEQLAAAAEPAAEEVAAEEQAWDGWHTIRMRVTAYCPCAKCCGRHSDGYTANGHHIRWGDRFVAADKAFVFGTRIKIPGYNDGRAVKVKDRGGAIKGYRLDVFFNSHSRAKKWGVKYLDIKVKY